MPSPRAVTTKNVANFGGLDSRSSDLNRLPVFARNIRNFDRWLGSTEASRPGYKGIAKGSGGGGLATYRRVNSTTQQTVEELVSISNKLHKLSAATFNITYSGAAASHTFSLIPQFNVATSTYSFHAILTEDGVDTLDYDCGTGVDEAAPKTITQLATAISAVTGWASASTGSTPCAYLPNCEALSISTAPGTNITYYAWTDIFSPISTPFSTFWSSVNTATFQNACLQNCDDQLFIATGANELYCYDSQGCYRAGMPAATSLSAALGAAGVLTGFYEYFITYEFTNKLGRVIEGDESNRVSASPAAQQIDATIPFLKASSGFYCNSAVVNAAPGSGATVTVTAGHTIQAGDSVIVFDGSGVPQERAVLSIGATSVVLDSSVNYTNVAPWNIITAGLVINLWRNAAGDSELKYLVLTIPNDGVSATASYVYSDNVADSTIIGYADYAYPERGHGLPPANLAYLTVYNGLLIGATRSGDAVYFSDWDGPHYFPESVSSFNLISKTSGVTTGLGANREVLIVTKENETHVVSGDLPASSFRQERLSDSIGASTHHVIADVLSSIFFWSDRNGARATTGSAVPDDLSYRVLPDFQNLGRTDIEKLVPSRAIACNHPDQQKLYLYLPAEQPVSTSFFHDDYSVVYVMDYKDIKEASPDGQVMVKWRPWDNINAQGGMTVYGGRLYWMERRYGDTIAAAEYNLCGQLQDYTQYDFCDHAQPYSALYEMQWIHNDEPSLIKKFIRARFYALDVGITSGFTCDLSVEANFLNGIMRSAETAVIGANVGTSSGWGRFAWGAGAWGDIDSADHIFQFRPLCARSAKLIVQNVENWCQQIRFSGVEVQLVPAYNLNIQEES